MGGKGHEMDWDNLKLRDKEIGRGKLGEKTWRHSARVDSGSTTKRLGEEKTQQLLRLRGDCYRYGVELQYLKEVEI